jgi:hypothetical protein
MFSRRSAAATLVRKLVTLEYRCHGDLDGALRRLANKTEVSFASWRRWWHASTEGEVEMLPGTYTKLIDSYRIECACQRAVLLKEQLWAVDLIAQELNLSPATPWGGLSLAGKKGAGDERACEQAAGKAAAAEPSVAQEAEAELVRRRTGAAAP